MSKKKSPKSGKKKSEDSSKLKTIVDHSFEPNPELLDEDEYEEFMEEFSTPFNLSGQSETEQLLPDGVSYETEDGKESISEGVGLESSDSEDDSRPDELPRFYEEAYSGSGTVDPGTAITNQAKASFRVAELISNPDIYADPKLLQELLTNIGILSYLATERQADSVYSMSQIQKEILYAMRGVHDALERMLQANILLIQELTGKVNINGKDSDMPQVQRPE